jgi:CubicO group peptidase (beta-lactamase class C family)
MTVSLGARQDRASFRSQVASIVLFSVVVPAGVVAQDRPPGMDSSQVRGPRDAAEVTAFLDGLMAAHLDDHDIAGATVAVVRNGEVLVQKGYGYANLEERRPVDPERTLFRIGSVTKLFTWIAVMQQVEEGTLSLDTDVNEYIDFEIPEAFGAPITLTHLLTHTPGFEDRGFRLFGDTEQSRRDYLAENMPSRVRLPGSFSAYSNYGTALAGHIVERVSGSSWEDYVKERILDPLGMEYASAHQPLPDNLEPYMSVGYSGSGNNLKAEYFETIGGAAPAGSMSASAGAMAKFMIANLQSGQLGENRILSEETVRLMHERLFTHDERLPGFAHGFYEKSSHGLRIIGHGGDTQWFHTDLALVHSENLGVFVSYNTGSGGQLSFGPFLDAFLDHYYPLDDMATAPAIDVDLERYTGSYLFNRQSYTTFEKALTLLGGPVEIAADDSTLILDSPLGSQNYVPVGENLFVERRDGNRLSFREDDAGSITHAFLANAPMMAMERVGGLSDPALHTALLGLAAVVFALTVLALPVRAWMRRRYAEVRRDTSEEKRARWVAWTTALCGLAFGVGLVMVLSNFTAIMTGSTGGLRFVLTLGVVTALLAVATVVFAVMAWRGGYWTTWGRVRYTVFASVAVTFVMLLNYWNLLGWRIG